MTAKVLKGPKVNYTVNSSLGEFFFNSAERFSDRICQIDGASDKKETYFSVHQRTKRVAIELQRRGITSKDVVVSCATISLDNVIPILASFYLGAKIANLDPSLSVRQTTHLLSLVSPSIIFVEESSVNLIEDSLEGANFKTQIVIFGQSTKYPTFAVLYADFVKPKENEEKFRPAKVDIHDTAIIFFSSGTTGLPKAICHSHYSFLHVAHSFYQSNVNCKVMLSFTSFYWVSASIVLISSLIAGGCRVFCATMDAENTYKMIEKYKVTFLFLAPILSYRLTNFERCKDYDTSSIYTVLVGGTPISAAQFQRLAAVFKYSRIIVAYGLTEVGLVSLFNPKSDDKFIKTKIGSCGKIATGLNVKIVDVETNEILKPNQKGEICVKSLSLMKGYYKVDNANIFDSDGFLKTGDIGYYDEDECLYVIERLKEMFKYMSWHIVPSAIEAVLLEHPAVSEAVIFGTPRGEEIGEVPTACVILKENCKVTKEEIEEFVAGRVSDNEKLRGGVIFVTKLLKTPSGKLMRKEIRNSFIS